MSSLIGDCGGTFSRFAIVENQVLTPLGRFRNREFTSLPALIASLNIKANQLVLAIAGPDNREQIAFTNCPFVANKQELMRLGFQNVLLMNDFVPLSLAATKPQKLDLTTLNGIPQSGHRLVIGAGTGLGVGILLQVGEKFMPLATETGHMDYTPDVALRPYFTGHTCLETFLSGEGFVRIYTALQKGSATFHTPETLVMALETDVIARQAAGLFFDILAKIMGDLALIFLPSGGLFITGGMVERLQKYVEPTRFLDIFSSKPPYQALLKSMPIAIVNAPDPAFIGLKALIETPEQFILQ